jgi:UDP-N-acetylmuramate--L-alanine ligase
MSALARLYLECGFRLTGSDQCPGAKVAELRRMGAEIGAGHHASRVHAADFVVSSPAIPHDNVERAEARLLGIGEFSRSKALAQLLHGREIVSVAGSHGKTSTTAILTQILDHAGLQPGFMIGGEPTALDGVSARWGTQPLFVCETCEAFRSLDHWAPNHVLITNIDHEHIEHYGDFRRLKLAFEDYVARVPAGGGIVLCGDDSGLADISIRKDAKVSRYGLSQHCNLRADILHTDSGGSEFLVLDEGVILGRVTLFVPGLHTIRNTLGAIAMALHLGVAFEIIVQAMAAFKPVRRRWEWIGDAGGLSVFDDFAHHPTEIRATLEVARAAIVGSGSLVVVFQPQLHSRVTRLAEEFAESLSLADRIYVLPIDAAGESHSVRDGESLLERSLDKHGLNAIRCDSHHSVVSHAVPLLKHGDLVVTLGPGPVDDCGRSILAALKSMASPQPQLLTHPPIVADHAVLPCTVLNRIHPKNTLLHSSFERSAILHPDKICLWSSTEKWTYAKLDETANRAANWLQSERVGVGSLVVLHLERSPQFIVLLLGILKAGAAYIPIDPLMARASFAPTLKSVTITLAISHDKPAFAAVLQSEAWDVHDAWALIEQASAVQPVSRAEPDDLAYGILTSGTTGEPKLVGVEHQSAAGLIRYSSEEMFDAQDLAIVPFIDSISFDACVHQIFATFALGGSLFFERTLANLVQSDGSPPFTSLGTTPSILARLIQEGTLPDSLRVVLLGGEVIPDELIRQLRAIPSIKKVFNLYGPTETTIFSTVSRIIEPGGEEDAQSTPKERLGNNIGFPLPGTSIEIIDSLGKRVPDGDIGEIRITGAGVARGYLGNGPATDARFFGSCDASNPYGRSYLTGDLGRRLPKGAFEFVGRIDDQMKINGVRIEPQEIESVIESFPLVAHAAVVLHDGPASIRKKLVAYVVCMPNLKLNDLQEYMTLRLPGFMMPRRIVPIAQLPLTVSGKVDRAALASLELGTQLENTCQLPPRDDVERRLISVWQEILQVDTLGIDGDFFELGGDSLNSMQLWMLAESQFDLRLPADTFENLSSVRNMATHIRKAMSTSILIDDDETNEFAETLRKQRAILASWVGERHTKEGYIVTHNASDESDGLFWCFQSHEELQSLAKELGPHQPIHGMRSGYLVMKYSPQTVAALATLYANEIMLIQPSGALKLGGNCQGGMIARATALILRGMGRVVSHLILMEQDTLWPYDEYVFLIFGKNSHYNPRNKLSDGNCEFGNIYAKGYSVHIIPGSHGEYFLEANLPGFAQVLRGIMDSSIS